MCIENEDCTCEQRCPGMRYNPQHLPLSTTFETVCWESSLSFLLICPKDTRIEISLQHQTLHHPNFQWNIDRQKSYEPHTEKSVNDNYYKALSYYNKRNGVCIVYITYESKLGCLWSYLFFSNIKPTFKRSCVLTLVASKD